MRALEGVTATIVGIVVSLVGLVVINMNNVWGAGILGFGVAHVILGVIDIIQNDYMGARD